MPSLATARYRSLIQQLAAELGGKQRGWKANVARKLRVHPSYVSRFENEPDIEVGRDAIDRAVESLGIADAFFFDELAPVDYRVHINAGDQAAARSALDAKALDVSKAQLAITNRLYPALDLASRTLQDLKNGAPVDTVGAVHALADAIAPGLRSTLERSARAQNAASPDAGRLEAEVALYEAIDLARETAQREAQTLRAIDLARQHGYRAGWEAGNRKHRAKRSDTA